MPSLSWQQRPDQLCITAWVGSWPIVCPAADKAAHLAAWSPDPRGWLVANQLGWVWYGRSQLPVADPNPWADWVRALGGATSWPEVDALLNQTALTDLPAFELWLFVHQQAALLWRWDGAMLACWYAPDSPKPFQDRAAHQTKGHWLTCQVRAHSLSIEPKPGQMGAASRLTLSLDPVSATPDAPFTSRVDVASRLRSLRPELMARIKPWQIDLLCWALGEPQLNRMLSGLNAMDAKRFCDLALGQLGLRLRLQAPVWPHLQQRPVFVCNHPTGGLDGILLLGLLQKRYPTIRVLANEVLTDIQQLNARMVAIPVFGDPKAALPAVQAAFAGDAPLLVFPAGRTARRDANGRLDDGAWAKLTVTLALRHQRSLCVMHLVSHNSAWFDGVANLRRRLGITTNLEMLMLGRELVRPACRQPHLYVDAPMAPAQLIALAPSNKTRMDSIKERSYLLPKLMSAGHRLPAHDLPKHKAVKRQGSQPTAKPPLRAHHD